MIKKTISSIKTHRSFNLRTILTCFFILIGIFFVLDAKAQVRNSSKKDKRQDVKTDTGKVESRQCSDESLIKNVELNGIRLAMSKAEVEKNLPGIKWTYRPEEI
jgi:hypothetical protein